MRKKGKNRGGDASWWGGGGGGGGGGGNYSNEWGKMAWLQIEDR